MNGDELKRNSVLTDVEVHDLNVDPTLPYEDNSFDVRAWPRTSCVPSTMLRHSTCAVHACRLSPFSA